MRHNEADEPTLSVDRVLLVRFLAGEVTPTEAAAVERWLAADTARGAELAELRQVWMWAGALPSESRIDALWQDLRQEIHQPEAPRARPALQLLPSTRSNTRRWLLGGLAAAGIVAAAGVALRADWIVPASVDGSERVYSTSRGQRSVVELADGSYVELGVDSRMRVRFHEDGRREVHLDGEAVFKVVHDERRPFLVYSGHAVTEDLGTRFGIRAYPGDSTVQVVVASGKVALRPYAGAAAARTAEVMLGPGDIGELDASGGSRVQHNADTDAPLAWTRGQLVFHDAPVKDVIARLERWYDIEIVAPDSLASGGRITLILDAPSLDEALEAVVVPLGWRYERHGRSVVLRS